MRKRKPLGWQLTIVGLLIFFLCTSCNRPESVIRAASPTQQTRQCALVTDLPFEPNEAEFKFQIWLDPGSEKSNQAFHVFLYANPNLKYDKSDFTLKAYKPQTITATRRQGSATLVEVIARADGDRCHGIDQTINFGFRASLKAELPQELLGGSRQAFTVKLIDEQGKSVALKAPAFVRLIGSNAKLRVYSNAPKTTVDISLQTGANATPLIEILPEKLLAGGNGSVQAELHASEQYILASSDLIPFVIPVAFWIQLLMGIVGGLLNAFYSVLRLIADSAKETWRDIGAKAGIGVVGGIVAVLFADKAALIGIKLEQTSLSGYVALGFIISYLGVDSFLTRLKPGPPSQQTLSLDSVVPSAGPQGTQVTVRGTGFQNGATVTFGTSQVSGTYVDPNTLTATVPALSAGPVRVTVANPDGHQHSRDAAFTLI